MRLADSVVSDDHVQGTSGATFRSCRSTYTRAALAAEASGAQTDFWTMHEYLFEHQNHLEELDLQKYATELGLDA